MLTSRYLTSMKNLSAILKKMVDGAAPERFTGEHLKTIGFAGSNDRALIGLLKDLGFLTADGKPTARYANFRDPSRSRSVLGEALQEAYSDVFVVSESPSEADRTAIEGVFRSKLNSTERVAKEQAATFLALLSLADLPKNGQSLAPEPAKPQSSGPSETSTVPTRPSKRSVHATLHYSIQIHLPATKDIEVFNAIFKSLKAHLLDD